MIARECNAWGAATTLATAEEAELLSGGATGAAPPPSSHLFTAAFHRIGIDRPSVRAFQLVDRPSVRASVANPWIGAHWRPLEPIYPGLGARGARELATGGSQRNSARRCRRG